MESRLPHLTNFATEWYLVFKCMLYSTNGYFYPSISMSFASSNFLARANLSKRYLHHCQIKQQTPMASDGLGTWNQSNNGFLKYNLKLWQIVKYAQKALCNLPFKNILGTCFSNFKRVTKSKTKFCAPSTSLIALTITD